MENVQNSVSRAEPQSPQRFFITGYQVDTFRQLFIRHTLMNSLHLCVLTSVEVVSLFVYSFLPIFDLSEVFFLDLTPDFGRGVSQP